MDNLFFKNSGPFKFKDILKELKIGNTENNQDKDIIDIKDLQNSKKNEITFFHSKKYKDKAKNTKASFCLTTENLKNELPKDCKPIIVENVLVATSIVTQKFYPNSIDDEFDITTNDIHKSDFAKNVNAGKNVLIGKNVKIHSQVYIGENVKINDNTVIYPGVKIYNNSSIGKNCIIHSGTVIGSDGFGFNIDENGNQKKVIHNGNVVIEDNVEIGSNSSIDKATLGSTKISKGVKIDNLVQIAHNVTIGSNTVIAAQVGIAGSTSIGSNCMIGGQVGISGHLKIGDRVMIQAKSGVLRSFESDVSIMGYPAIKYRDYNKSYVHFKNLPEIIKKLDKFFKKNNNE